MSDFALSQLLAAIAFACGMVSFQCKGRRPILLWLSVSAYFNGCHFFVLDVPEAGTLFLIMGTRSIAATFSTNRKTMFLFLGLACVGFYFSYKNPLGFLALSGTLLATYASFQKAEKRVRVIFGLSAIIWIAHNILVRSPVAALMEATLQASNAVGYWRFHRSNKYTSD